MVNNTFDNRGIHRNLTQNPAIFLSQNESLAVLEILRNRSVPIAKADAHSSPHGFVRNESSECAFPIVYNKPHKTGSTFLKAHLANWAKSKKRPLYDCGGNDLDSAARLHDCVQAGSSSCGVMNAHLVLSGQTLSYLEKVLPNFRLMTSTRYPPMRILSAFLQYHKIEGADVKGKEGNELFRKFMHDIYEEWGLYNFHFGDTRVGSCPPTRAERAHIYEAMGRYDIVVDLTLPDVSNIILRRFGLFNYTEIMESQSGLTAANVRGSSLDALDDESKELMKNKSCIEWAMHRAMQNRMASTYDKARGTFNIPYSSRCLPPGRLETITSCLEGREKVSLGSVWDPALEYKFK